MNDIKLVKFREINLQDTFFDSLRNDYEGFNDWFIRKENEEAYVLKIENRLEAFLYMKIEEEEDSTIIPQLFFYNKILKVGTFKINAHGSKLGERFVKLIFDKMIEEKLSKAYVTIFEKQVNLISLLEEYGFFYWGKKKDEYVYLKDFNHLVGNIKKDYPMIKTKGTKKFLLSIWPPFHTELFPDSKLRTEKNHIIRDLSHTNCIEKVYLSGSADILNYKKGDLIAIYRTAEKNTIAEYTAVVTSICTVSEIRNINEFRTINEFLEFCSDRTIFTEDKLVEFWRERRYPYIITLLYNSALNKRIIRKELIEEIGVSRSERLVVFNLTDEQMNKILEIGGIDGEIIR